jgi:phage gp29-like protein
MKIFQPSTWFSKPLKNRDPISGMVATGRAVNLKELFSDLNRYREYLNPLRGYTLERVVQWIEQGERGEFADLMWAERKVEKASPTMIGLIKRWRAALRKLDWEIKIVSELPAGATDAMAEAQQQTLRAAYEKIDNLREAFAHLVHARFRGFAHVQRHRENGEVVHLECLDQWNFVRDGIYGDWYFNQGGEPATHLSLDRVIQIPDDVLQQDWIVRQDDLPVNEIALRYYAYEALAMKDWASFIEIYGIPSGIVIMPPNIPDGKEAEYETAAIEVSEGGGGALPNGSDYKPNDQPRGTNPFKEFLDYAREQIVLAGTSGKLTMLNDATGLGSGQSQSHQDTFDDLAEAEALEISELFQRTLDREILDAAHAGEPVLAYFELCAQTDEDVTEICTHAQLLNSAGYKIDSKQLAEKTGYTLEEKAEPQPLPGLGGGFAGARQPEQRPGDDKDKGDVKPEDEDEAKRGGVAANGAALRNREMVMGNERLAAAFAEDLAPIQQRLQAILEINDPEILRTRLHSFLQQLPQLRKDILADPASAVVLLDEMSGAIKAGLAGKKP